MGSTTWNTKNGLIRLFMDRIYDSDMIYRVNLKNQTLQFGYSSDCMTRLMDLGNCHKSKGGVFEMSSDNEGRLERYISMVHFPNHLRLATVTSC